MLKEIRLLDLNTNRECIPTVQAVKRAGLSKTYLTQLLRKEELAGFQLGREWLIYTDSLEQYLATHHKPGPKGPRKKPEQNHTGIATMHIDDSTDSNS